MVSKCNNEAVASMIVSRVKTVSAATSAAEAVHECRVIAGAVLGIRARLFIEIDDKLYALEMAYWKRADEIRRKPKSGGKRGRR